jgi:hypothetical protein
MAAPRRVVARRQPLATSAAARHLGGHDVDATPGQGPQAPVNRSARQAMKVIKK